MRRKVLFILCNDFGELVMADYFAEGQPIDAIAFCSPKLLSTYDKNTIQLLRHNGLQEILTCIEDFQPDTVILASGYLLTLHNLLSIDELRLLLDILTKKKIAVATTDPWMKCWEEFRNHLDDDTKSALLANPFQRLQEELDELLRPMPHIYSTPFKTDRVPSFSFFNSNAFTHLSNKPEQNLERWLFILASIDYDSIAGINPSGFFDALVERFTEILVSPSASIVFICPPPCVDALLRRTITESSRLVLVPFCSFTEFQRHIFSSDIGVYWNHLSASIIYCLHKQGAALFADRGHMLTACPPLAWHAHRAAWNCITPLNIDILKPITQDVVQAAAHSMHLMTTRIYPEYARLPTPLEMIEKIRRFNCEEIK